MRWSSSIKNELEETTSRPYFDTGEDPPGGKKKNTQSVDFGTGSLALGGGIGQSDGGWVEPANSWNGGIGVLAGAAENLPGSIGTNGKYYASGWGGNQYVSTIKVTKVGKVLGIATLFGGTIIDAIGVRYYYKNGLNDPNAVHPGKAGLNLGIGIWSLINPAAATGAVLYYGIDTFYPGGFNGAMQYNANLLWQNQQILGPDFNLYRDW
ncbi:MAG: hypothetical protein KatS3mg027_2476 [Bacteroidia bacterium]|nr:MAG: hypothetical protein KatS3mg027_2476 [Bacteroidia bacterium]